MSFAAAVPCFLWNMLRRTFGVCEGVAFFFFGGGGGGNAQPSKDVYSKSPFILGHVT